MPWSASCGATTKAKTTPRPSRAAVANARSGRLFRDDIFERGPRKYREHQVVEAEEGQVRRPVGRDAGADAADHEGDGERQEEERQDDPAAPAPGPPPPATH